MKSADGRQASKGTPGDEVDRLRKQIAERDQRERDLESRVAKAESARIELLIDREIEREARGQFQYPENAPSLVDRDRVIHDPETGQITGAKEAVKRLAKGRPGLLNAKRGGGSPSAIGIQSRPAHGVREAMNRGNMGRQPSLREIVAVRGGLDPM